MTHFDTLPSVSSISRVHRLSRAVDTLNTVFFQPTRKSIYLSNIPYFFLAHIRLKKGVFSVSAGRRPPWLREKPRHTSNFPSVSENRESLVLPDKMGKSLTHHFFAIVCRDSFRGTEATRPFHFRMPKVGIMGTRPQRPDEHGKKPCPFFDFKSGHPSCVVGTMTRAAARRVAIPSIERQRDAHLRFV